MSRARKATVIILAVLVVSSVALSIFMWQAGLNLDALAALSIEDIDLSQISAGTYRGAYRAFPIAVELEVTVQDNQIAAIALLKHRNGRGKAAEVIPARVIEAQSLAVDTVAGATYSCQVLLLAIKQALANGIDQ